ncbi:hypothetical protein E2C01_073863 [Portunus trituberculatus]|uniref:Secreted protein n=1 Tax=Portunus trituberculatus TaxID=210409 RepID=A0A5B7I440_PORTR|nr:hypothetical protein [Portunus trituberculatus]
MWWIILSHNTLTLLPHALCLHEQAPTVEMRSDPLVLAGEPVSGDALHPGTLRQRVVRDSGTVPAHCSPHKGTTLPPAVR